MIIVWLYFIIAGLGILSLPSWKVYIENSYVRIGNGNMKPKKYLTGSDGVYNDPWASKAMNTVDWWHIDWADKNGEHEYDCSVGAFMPPPVAIFLLSVGWPVYILCWMMNKLYHLSRLNLLPGFIGRQLAKPGHYLVKRLNHEKDPYLLEGEKEVERLLTKQALEQNQMPSKCAPGCFHERED